MEELRFDKTRKYGLAFSGGCDSACLLAEMLDAGVDVKAYLVKTAFQADFELEDAAIVARQLGVDFEVVEADVLAEDAVCANPPDRCYRCKLFIFGRILERMARDGRDVLADGTNATDDPAHRPGFRALAELGVVSPLREAGWTKDDVRARSRARGLVTADKPNFSCFATKVPEGQRITAEALAAAEEETRAVVEAWRRERDAGRERSEAKAVEEREAEERGREVREAEARAESEREPWKNAR